jgi:hypothetical protein
MTSDQLITAIKEKYLSLDEPDFSFVNKAVRDNMYRFIIEKLANIFDVTEVTDLNDDVCFRYVLKKDSQSWVLEISMLGPYAVIIKTTAEMNYLLVEAPEMSKYENQIVSALNLGAIVLLKKMQLEEQCNLKLFNTGSEKTCIYQALFSDVTMLPWKI